MHAPRSQPPPLSRRLIGLSLAAVIGCGTESQEVRPDASVGPDTPDASEVPPMMEPDPCALEVAPIMLRQGSRLDVELGAAVMAAMRGFSTTPAIEATAHQDGISLWASYEASSESLTLEREGCESLTIPIEVRPLEWSLLASWSPEVEGGPPAREYGAWSLAQMGERRGLFVVGGFHYRPRQFTPSNDVWFFDLETRTWAEFADAGSLLTPGGRFAPGPEPDSLFFFGGAQLASDGALDTPPQLRLFRYAENALSWEDAPFSSLGPGSYTGAFIRDERRDRWLSICGVDTNVLGVNCSVAEYRVASGWRPVQTAGATPPGRYGFHYGFDEENDRVIVVGGQGEGETVRGDTWALELSEDPPRWVQVFIDDPAVRRRNGAFAFDPVGHRLILWGGTADGRSAVPGLSILRLDREKEGWTHLSTPTSVPPRASGFAVYDGEGQRLLLGFGNAAALYTDLYSLGL